MGGRRRGNGAKRNDLADWNPEPPLGGEAYTVCYVPFFLLLFIFLHIANNDNPGIRIPILLIILFIQKSKFNIGRNIK